MFEVEFSSVSDHTRRDSSGCRHPCIIYEEWEQKLPRESVCQQKFSVTEKANGDALFCELSRARILQWKVT
jgi:hypothetical protein